MLDWQDQGIQRNTESDWHSRAQYIMRNGGLFRFQIIEYCGDHGRVADFELSIREPSGYYRIMAKNMFDTPSQARAAAQAFVKEYLA